MDGQLKQQQQNYDNTWQYGLEAGKEQRGNLTVNLEFIETVGLAAEGVRVLELGCGIGSIVNELTDKGCRAIGTDISNKAIEYGKRKYPNVDLRVAAAEKLDFEDGAFDIVMSFDVIEHLKEVDEHIQEVSRVLTDGGYYVLQTPNKYFNSVFETIKLKSFEWKSYHPSLHSAGQIRKRFKKHGYEVRFVKMNTINEFSLNKIKSSIVRGLVKSIDFKKLPISMQTNFYIVAKKH